jgi:hypothetical protein
VGGILLFVLVLWCFVFCLCGFCFVVVFLFVVLGVCFLVFCFCFSVVFVGVVVLGFVVSYPDFCCGFVCVCWLCCVLVLLFWFVLCGLVWLFFG